MGTTVLVCGTTTRNRIHELNHSVVNADRYICNMENHKTNHLSEYLGLHHSIRLKGLRLAFSSDYTGSCSGGMITLALMHLDASSMNQARLGQQLCPQRSTRNETGLVVNVHHGHVAQTLPDRMVAPKPDMFSTASPQ